VALDQRDATVAAAEHGFEIIVWTLNDPNRVGELANLGVTGIITDDPGAMTAALEGNP
jgi:glycerophosphoryl diester phosphodiesterase